MASIRERVAKSGDTTFQVLYRHDRKQCSKTFATRPDAEMFATAVDRDGPDQAVADLVDEHAGGLTVDELADAYFDWKAGQVTPRTLKDYRRDYANWLQPFLGHRPAEAITERDVQRVVDHMAKRLDPKSVADRHMVLHSIYAYGSAKVRGLVSHNPCRETELPRRKRKHAKGVTLPEWEAIYAEALRSEPAAADLLLFIASTGWRWSEAAALTVRGVEEDGATMHASVASVFRRDALDRQVLVEGAKSHAGVRRVKVPAGAAAAVRRRLAGKGPDDLVFTTARGGPWRQGNFLARTWRGIVDRAGLDRRPTPHWLRHTHVAMLNRAGVSLPEIQRRLGHEDIQTTINVYGGMIDDISDAALAQIDALLTGPGVVQGAVVVGELG